MNKKEFITCLFLFLTGYLITNILLKKNLEFSEMSPALSQALNQSKSKKNKANKRNRNLVTPRKHYFYKSI